MIKITHLSIKIRLIASMAFLVSLIIVGNTLVENFLQIKNAQEMLIREAEVANNVLVQDYARFLYADDTETAADIISKLASFPMIQHADLFNQESVNLLHYSRQTNDPHLQELSGLSSGQFQDKKLLISFPVVINK
ncbi:MAG: hypothetical protein KAG26_08905, partial [Methylococcales bacterium]|nr:hypothetical protein [Methylococcales bacterium]